MRRRVPLVATALLSATLLSSALGGCAAVAGVSDPPTATVGGVLSSSRAQDIADQVVETAQKADAATGADGDALRSTAYTGDVLTAAGAAAKLAGTLTQAQKDALALTPNPPVVLAVSAGLSYPRTMVVETVRARSGLPVLSLLVTPDVRTPFKIAASAQMLPSTEVPAFDQVAQGAPALGEGSGLAVAPDTLLAAYASSLAYPAPVAAAASAAPPFTDDAFAVAIKAGASAAGTTIGAAGSYSEQHQAKDVAGGLRLGGGQGALVFGVMDRTETILNKGQGTITASAGFAALTGLQTIKAEATLDTLEFVAVVVPESGQAKVVAAREQLVSATGT